MVCLSMDLSFVYVRVGLHNCITTFWVIREKVDGMWEFYYLFFRFDGYYMDDTM